MPMINIVFTIRLDPERIIVAPVRFPGRSNFVVESFGNLVARRRHLQAFAGSRRDRKTRSIVFGPGCPPW